MRDVYAAVAEYEALIGGYASYTHRMLEQYGPVETLSKLMADSKIQKGLKTLAKAGRTDMSFEAVVVKHAHLFKKSIVDAAQWRLEQARSGAI
jgi:hypothetical protein